MTESELYFNPLTDDERSELETYESQIESGLVAFYNIKMRGLWREYSTFAAYMQARWNIERRRTNQLMAGYRVILTLTDALQGTDVPLPTNENQVRSLTSVSSPETAAKVYMAAVEMAGGKAPGGDQVMLARQMILTPEEIRRTQVMAQLVAMGRYRYLEEELRTGGDPARLLGLAVALESCETPVRQVMMRADVRDLALIRAVNEAWVNGREMAKEILITGALQFGEYGIPLTRATVRDFRRLADQKYKEHLQQERDVKRGEPVSVVLFNHDPLGTFHALKQVLDYSTLISLSNILSQI